MATLAGAMVDALTHEAEGAPETEAGTRSTMALATVERLIADRPDAPQRGAGERGDADDAVPIPERAVEADRRVTRRGDPQRPRPRQRPPHPGHRRPGPAGDVRRGRPL